MYFMLGDIALEAINLTEFSETHRTEFAEHAVLKGKPRLQALGEKLIELSFAVRLHHKIGGVESRYQALVNTQRTQQPLALMWGRGKFKGYFVINELSSNTLFTDGQGNVLCRELTVNLTEFVGEMDSGILGAALNLGSQSLLGSILPAGLVNILSEVKTAVQEGVQFYQRGRQVVDELKNTMALMRQFRHDPQTVFAYLPSALNHLDQALGDFGDLTHTAFLFAGLQKTLPAVAEFSREVGDIYRDLNLVKEGLLLGQHSNTRWDNWFVPADNALSLVTEQIDNLATPVATMTAWIVLRDDEELTNDSDRT